MAPIKNPDGRFWRTDLKVGRNIYVLMSNDIARASDVDQLIGVMETSELAEDVVQTHNAALRKFGRRYQRALNEEEV